MQFTLAFVLAALPFLTSAAPTPEPIVSNYRIPIYKRSGLTKRDGTANVQALQAHIAHSVAKINRGFDAYQRNTGRAHPLAGKGGNSKRGSGSDALTDAQAEYWYGEIKVGTPAETYKVDFDTGSSDLFLPGPDCTENCSSHKTYDPKKSSSSKDRKKTFSLAYGDGSTVSGEQYTETVEIAGLKATKQAIGAAKTYSSGFGSDFIPDGLMGMAFEDISDYNAMPPFQRLMHQNKVDQSVFAFKLAPKDSELTVGTLNKDLYTGSFSYTDIKSTEQPGFWEIPLDSVEVDGKSVVKSTSSIIDTGTTLIIGDESSVKSFYKSIDGAKAAPSSVGEGLYTVPCDSIPDVSVTFSGKSYPISSSSFSLGAVSSGSSDCVGGIAYSPGLDEPFWIVGDVFLQNVYTAFDAGKKAVGFAKLK